MPSIRDSGDFSWDTVEEVAEGIIRATALLDVDSGAFNSAQVSDAIENPFPLLAVRGSWYPTVAITGPTAWLQRIRAKGALASETSPAGLQGYISLGLNGITNRNSGATNFDMSNNFTIGNFEQLAGTYQNASDCAHSECLVDIEQVRWRCEAPTGGTGTIDTGELLLRLMLFDYRLFVGSR